MDFTRAMSSLNFGCIFLLIATKYNLGKKRNENRKGRTERKEKGKGIQSTTRTSQPSKKMREKKYDERKVKVNIRII